MTTQYLKFKRGNQYYNIYNEHDLPTTKHLSLAKYIANLYYKDKNYNGPKLGEVAYVQTKEWADEVKRREELQRAKEAEPEYKNEIFSETLAKVHDPKEREEMIKSFEKEVKRREDELRHKMEQNPEPPSKAIESDSVHSSELERLDKEERALRLGMFTDFQKFLNRPKSTITVVKGRIKGKLITSLIIFYV